MATPGKYSSPRANAAAAIPTVCKKFENFRKKADEFTDHFFEVGAGTCDFDKGKANRLNDYVRDLAGTLHNLERWLAEAGM